MAEKYDVAVIGGGPAGYVGAIKAAMRGAKVILFEKDVVGGTCLNRGCIPTKSYLKTAQAIDEIKNASKRGIINDPETKVDILKAVAYKNSVVKKLTGGVAGLLRSHGVKTVYGKAELLSETKITCCGEEYEAGSIILCGGSVPGSVPIKGFENKGVLTSDEILDIEKIPETLVVIGGGVIGCEIATAFAAFGSKVTIVEFADSLLPMLDSDLSAFAEKNIKARGIDVYTKTAVSAIEKNGNMLLVKAGDKLISCENVLISVGRKPDLSCLGKLSDKIATQKGYVTVDDNMRTNIKNIYAPGDINGKIMLAHSAFKMGETAAINATGGNERCNLKYVPSCVYTLPEIACVGLAQKAAEEKFGKANISIGFFPFSANGRALAGGHPDGFIKVVADKKYGEILGVHMAGEGVTEMIAEGAALMTAEITVYEAADTIHPHPTCSEAFMEACSDAVGSCIHLPKK